MGLNEGFLRLNKGFKRKLTNSELMRGYLFISTDRKIMQLKKLHIIVNGVSLGNKEIDSYGRISFGKKLTNRIGNTYCYFKLKNNTILIKY